MNSNRFAPARDFDRFVRVEMVKRLPRVVSNVLMIPRESDRAAVQILNEDTCLASVQECTCERQRMRLRGDQSSKPECTLRELWWKNTGERVIRECGFEWGAANA